MAVTPFKTFISGEILTASDLNLSFTRITDNGEDVPFPSTKAIDFNGQSLILDADQDTHITADTDDQIDFAISGSDRYRMLLDTLVPDFRTEWDDAGAAVGPSISVFRNSATPAVDDLIGKFRWLGKNSAAETIEFGNIQIQLSDVTDGTEDARMIFQIQLGGALSEIFRIGAGQLIQFKSIDAGAAEGPDFRLFRDSSTPADSDIGAGLNYYGRNSAAEQIEYAGIQVVFEDVTDATEDGYLQFKAIRAGAEVKSLSPGILLGPFSTTSGTSVDTGQVIPTTARKLTLMFNLVSADAADDLIIQLGDAGGIETTGYTSLSAEGEATPSLDMETNTAGFQISQNQASAVNAHGIAILYLSDASTNTWMGMSLIGSGGSKMSIGTTVKALSAAITQLRLTTTGGTAAFDNGSFSVLVE